MSATARNFNPVVEIFNPYSVHFANKQERNMDDNQQTSYECSLTAVQSQASACTPCSACCACSACG